MLRYMPAAVCKRYGLAIGASLSWMVHLLMWVFFPVAYPIALLLDWMLGKETLFFRCAKAVAQKAGRWARQEVEEQQWKGEEAATPT